MMQGACFRAHGRRVAGPVAIGLALLATLAAAACGGSTGQGKHPANQGFSPQPAQHALAPIAPDETGKAAAALLDARDFPAGWTESPSSTNHSTDSCAAKSRSMQTGRAETGYFSGNTGPDVHETVSVYRTNTDAIAGLGMFPGQLQCAVQLINAGKTDTDDTHFSQASEEALPYATMGDQSAAVRMHMHFKQNGGGAEGDIYVDTLWVVAGRYAFDVQVSSMSAPAGEAELTSSSAMALARIRAALVANPPN